MLYRAANWLFFKTEPLSGTSRFGLCTALKCPLHMSINRTCAAHRAVYITNVIETVYLLRHCRASYIGGAELHTRHNKCSFLVRLSIAPWTRAIKSFSDVTGVPHTTLFILFHRKWSRAVKSGDHGTGPPLTVHRFGCVTLRWFRTFLSTSADR